MKKHVVFLVLFTASLGGSAQQGNNWVFNWHSGMDFNYNPPRNFESKIQDATIPGRAAKLPQTISDCNGRLLYYTGGDSLIWNREHKQLFNNQLSDNGGSPHSFFVPHPTNDSFTYLFQSHNGGLDYFLLNNQLDSGRGGFTNIKVHVSDSGGETAAFVKHSNDTDYWILVKPSAYTIHAYLLTKNGVNKKPVASKCYGKRSCCGGNSPYLRVSNNGKFIISTELYLPNQTYFIYDFDKSTGIVSNRRTIVPSPAKKPKREYSFSFSPNDSILYAFTINDNYDTSFVYQLPVYGNINVLQNKPVYTIDPKKYGYGWQHCQLGPDNRLYWQTSSDSNYEHISYIKYPDVLGKGCELVLDGFELDTGQMFGSEFFPCHSYPIKRVNPRFSVTGADGCGTDTLRFTFDGDSTFSTFRWYFGDGDSADGRSVLHQYKQQGNYYARLACTLGNCGYRQWVGDSVHYKLKPGFALYKTKDEYTCGAHNTDIKLAWKYADTVHFWRTDGTDTLMAVGYDSVPDSLFYSHSYGTGNYFTAATAWNSQCKDSISITENIIIEPSVPVSFAVSNQSSCSSATFDFRDTSGYDSIVQDRHWHIHYPSGKDTVVTTLNTDSLNIYLDEAGKYDVKLVHATRQGCVDSLEKMQYISILSPLSISITPTSTYTCGKNTLDLAITYRYADSLRLWLNGMDTVFATTNSPQPATINQTHVWQLQIPASAGMTDMDTFAVKVINSQCSDSIGYIHSLKIDPPAAASFQTNNPASCGSSTFTFSDTSHLDSIVVKRTWALRQTQSDTTITSSQNTLNITLTDTGKYTVTLTQTTRQGCVDSLAKSDFVWVHPLPEPVIKVDGNITLQKSICFGDTAILSVIPANAGILKYQWSNGDTTQILKVTKPGTYSVKVWDEWNCYATSEPVQLKWLPELKVTLYKTKDSLLAKPNRAVVTYEWVRNSQPITGNSQSFLYHADSGTYQVNVTDSNGCTATSNYQKFYWTGIAQLQIPNEELRIYPNPANTILYLNWLPKGNHTIYVTDLAGKQILSTRSNSETTIIMNIEQLASGIYFIEVAGQHLKFVKE